MKKEIYTQVKLVDNMHFSGANSAGLGAEMDSKPAGEPVAGATPMELVLQAAGACSGMDVAGILRKRKFEIDVLDIEVVGHKREAYPRIFESINLTYRAGAKGLTIEELKKAVDLSVGKYCAVIGMLRESSRISYNCELVK